MDLGPGTLGKAAEASFCLGSRSLGAEKRGLGLATRPLGIPIVNHEFGIRSSE